VYVAGSAGHVTVVQAAGHAHAEAVLWALGAGRCFELRPPAATPREGPREGGRRVTQE